MNKQIADYIMLFDFEVRQRAMIVSTELKHDEETKKKFLKDVFDGLPPKIQAIWRDEVFVSNL